MVKKQTQLIRLWVIESPNCVLCIPKLAITNVPCMRQRNLEIRNAGYSCHRQLDCRQPPPSGLSIGSLSNDDGDVNENGKKAKGLDWQNNSSARASRFFVHFFTFSAMSNFTFSEGREHTTTTFFFVSWTLMIFFRIQIHKNLPTFELNEMEQAR